MWCNLVCSALRSVYSPVSNASVYTVSVPRVGQLGNLHEIVCVTVVCANVACQVDKRNHELGLWLLDSLPKATMKEVLQSVCREVSNSMLSYCRCFSPAPHNLPRLMCAHTYLFA
jgi:hypothetical protein